MPAIRGFLARMDARPDLMDRAPDHFVKACPQYWRVMDRDENANYYIVDLLTKEGADYFLEVADKMSDYFSPNETEGKEYQIPEVQLDRYLGTHDADWLAREIGREILWPLFTLMYGNPPTQFAAVQLARYSAEDTRGTGWHCDSESEASCVVSLAPERHKGGGTLIMPYGVFGHRRKIYPLLKGQALLFNGRTTLHRGLELEEGQRNLLVYWMNAFN